MDSEKTSIAREMIRAVARCDDKSFQYWRDKLNQASAFQDVVPDLLYEVFRSAVVLRFANLDQAKQIDAFVEHDRPLLWTNLGFSRSKARRLIRSALGERGMVDDISTSEAAVIRLQAIAYLIEDMSMTSEQIDWLISEAERWVVQNSPLA